MSANWMDGGLSSFLPSFRLLLPLTPLIRARVRASSNHAILLSRLMSNVTRPANALHSLPGTWSNMFHVGSLCEKNERARG